MFRYRRWHVPVIIVAAAVALLGYVLFAPLVPARDAQSPDGAFLAFVQVRVIDMTKPAMDRPGLMTMFGLYGRSCGSVWLDRVSLFDDLRWHVDAKPRTARIGPVATWNLDDCRIEESGG